MKTIANEIAEQFRRQWKTVMHACEVVPEDQWKAGDIDYLVPVRQIYHIVFTTDMYINDMSYESYKPHRRYTIDWEGGALDDLPTLDEIKVEIAAMESKLSGWIEAKGDEGLLAEEDGYPWVGKTKLSRLLYLLRHNQCHIGELNSELRRRELARAEW